MADPNGKCEWKIRRLKRAWDAGLTADEIAYELGYANANVIKVLRHRHNLPKRKYPRSLFRDWSKDK